MARITSAEARQQVEKTKNRINELRASINDELSRLNQIAQSDGEMTDGEELELRRLAHSITDKVSKKRALQGVLPPAERGLEIIEREEDDSQPPSES